MARKENKNEAAEKPKKSKWGIIALVIALIVAVGSCGGDDSENQSGEAKASSEVVSIESTEEVITAAVQAENEPESEIVSAMVETETEVIPVEDGADNLTLGQKNALKSALSYLDYSAFSYSGLVGQLEYEGYTNEEAIFAVDNCGADWSEQALRAAGSYLDYSAFSYSGLIKQLEYEGYTNEQAVYGADNCGADWNEQAAKSAESYLEYSAFSKDELIGQLEYEGFTTEQAEYGVSQVGY